MTTFLKAFLRNFRSNKTYSLLNIAGLAIGIACAALIFLWVGDEMTFDHVNNKKDRLYSVMINGSYGDMKFTMGSTPRLMASSLKAEIPGIADACRVSDNEINALFSVGENSMYVPGRYADPSIFSMFTFTFVQGNVLQPYSQIHSVVLTETAVKKFFGNEPNVIGRSLKMDNDQLYVVSGVVKDMPANTSLQFEWLAPYQALMEQDRQKYGGYDDKWSSYGPLTYVELTPSANTAAVDRQLLHYIGGKDASQENTAFLYPMSRWHLYNEFAGGKETGGGRIGQVKWLSVIAWVILLIACINFMNLATARSEKRAKDIGVRKVLGSGRRRLIGHFIAESLMMSAIAAMISLILISLTLPAFNILVHKQLTLGLDNPAHIIALFLIILVSGLLAGSYPSLYLSSFDPVKALKGVKIRSGSAALIRKGLVVVQFAVSVAFIISTVIIYMQVQHTKGRDLGFDKNGLLEVDMQHNVKNKFSVIKQELLATGLVQNAALSDHVTLSGGNLDSRFDWDGKVPGSKTLITFRTVSPEFMATSGMRLIDGNGFSGEPSDTLNTVITRSLATMIDKNNSVVGRIIRSPRGMKEGSFRNLKIVGVVQDYVFGNMYSQAGSPVIFLGMGSQPTDGDYLYIRIKDHQVSQQTLARIEKVVKTNDPGFPFQYKFVDDQFNQRFANEVQMSRLSGLFASLAIVISCLGLFGLSAYTVERRIKEIGIRKVLGASVPGIAGLLSVDFLQLVGFSCLVAFPAAWYFMHNWLQNYAYRIDIQWWVFAAAGAGALLIALVTVSFQTLRAALANPVKALRSE